MLRFGISAICVLQVALSVLADGYYSVIAPGTLHSDSKYNVAVTLYNTVEPSQLKVGITGPSYNETKTVELSQSGEVKLIQFDVPELEEGSYNLTAEGVAGVQFFNTTRLNYERFQPYVLTQTDKGTYKPGNVMRFRLIFLDADLLPTQVDSSTKVYIEDSKRNRVKEIRDFKVVNGVYSGTFPISEHAVLGDWRLGVETGSNRNTDWANSLSFEVNKYVLPKYVVKVEANEAVAVQDGDIQAVVRANYTYGKPVNGKVTLLLGVQRYFWRHTSDGEEVPEIPAIIKTADMVNGKAKFDFSVKEYETRIDSEYPSWLKITATVEEEFTGVKLNATADTRLYPYRYTAQCETYNTCSNYHPDKEAEVVVQILHVDGSLLQDTKSVVRLIYVEQLTKHWTSKESDAEHLPQEMHRFEFESHLNTSSVAVFKVTLPELAEIEGYSHYFKGTVEYAGEKKNIISAYPYRKPRVESPTVSEESKDYFKVSINSMEGKYSLVEDEETTVTINSSRPINYFVYTIIGRGNVFKHERIELPEPQEVCTFQFVPSYKIAPYANIYVHYVDDGEYRYAETSAYIDWKFKNKITIEGPEEVKVGEDVRLTIKTEPHSFVGLLGVDQSVLLIGGNNDLNEDQVHWRLGGYSTYTPNQGGFSQYPGEYSGVVTLTNAKYLYNRTRPEWHRRGGFVAYDSTTAAKAPPQASGMKPTVLKEGLGGVAVNAASAPPTVRKDFSETWIFADIENTESESFTWSKKIPDTITSWVVTGFSLNSEKGFASTKEDTKIRSFQPFFVSIRLPYSVKRGEVISVPALVFNYLTKDLDVEVTLDNTDGEFEFTEASNNIADVKKQSKTIRVPSSSARGVSFMLRPIIVGNILLKFTAISPVAGDAVHKTLKVIPEGVTQYVNRAFFVNLKGEPEASETFELELPAEIVPDSVRAEFSIVGDLLGPLLNNLDNLVRLPTGCGEQTMSALVPNYLVMHYIKGTNNPNTKLESRIKHNLERGYQNMLYYQHEDGSFSSFGPTTNLEGHPRNGSTWLTAYVMRFLRLMTEYVDIDPKVFKKGLTFLTERQASNGSFLEQGDFFYRSQRNEISLTSTVCLALLQNLEDFPDNTEHLNNGLEFIANNVQKIEDLQIKSLATFTLHQGKHSVADKMLADLKAMAKSDGDRRWWSTALKDKRKGYSCCWWRWPRSDEVETTSYNLLTILDQESPQSEEVLQIVKWLVAQRNSFGGFASTQDTVVGLQAIIKFAEQSGYEAANMDIDFKSTGSEREKNEMLKISEENALLMQTFELPAKTSSIEFHAKGKGTALVQVSYQYNLVDREPAPTFSLTTVINPNTPVHKLEMDVCVAYVGEDGESNMALLEVALPSGYVADADSFEELRKVDRVRHVESKNADTTIVIYFESLKKDDNKCLLVEAFKTHAVALQKPTPIVVYDYYDTSKKAATYYEVASKLCDICDKGEESCQKTCN